MNKRVRMDAKARWNFIRSSDESCCKVVGRIAIADSPVPLSRWSWGTVRLLSSKWQRFSSSRQLALKRNSSIVEADDHVLPRAVSFALKCRFVFHCCRPLAKTMLVHIQSMLIVAQASIPESCRRFHKNQSIEVRKLAS